MKNELEPPIFSLTTFPPRRLSSKHLPPSVGMVSKFFCWYQKHWDDVHRVILLANSCISSFSSVLVRNSAISSADWSEHCWLFSCSLTHQLVTVKYMVLWWLFLFKTCVNSDQVSPQTWSKIQTASVYTGNRLRPWLILRRHLTISGFGSDKKIKRRFRSGFCNASEWSGVLVAYPSCVKSLQSIVRV